MRKALLSSLLMLVVGVASATSYDSGSFDTTSYDENSFDFGTTTGTVPDCTSTPTTSAACQAVVTSAGFVPAVINACSGTVTSGDVISTTPPAGSSLDIGQSVTIIVSTGVACKGFLYKEFELSLSLGL